MSIKVILVEDHAIVREGLRSLLERERDITVVGEASDGRTGVKLAKEQRPDIVIMDIGLPDLNGIEATRQIKTEVPTCKVICLSMHREKKLVGAMLDAGSTGYVLKNDVCKELVGAVRSVHAGGTHLSPTVAGDVVRHYVRDQRDVTEDAFTILSPREREVMQLIAEGLSSKQIAGKLTLSEKTIAAHREHIMAKLKLHNAAELTRYAIREGIAQL
jgi:DNA-binding NarL/FixJ family response regulator